MGTSICVHAVRTKKDVILARQRARQIAGMVGFNSREQAEIAAAAFVLAVEALRQWRPASLHFTLEQDALCAQVETQTPADGSLGLRPRPALHLKRPLPPGPIRFSAEDVRFLTEQLAQSAPGDLFAEISRQNSELIQVFHELRSVSGKPEQGPSRDANVA